MTTPKQTAPYREAGAAPDTRRSVIVGVDGSEGSEAALDLAAAEAMLRALPLEVVVSWRYWPSEGVTMVTPDFAQDAQAIAAKAVDRVRSTWRDLDVVSQLSSVPPAIELVRASVSAELLVVGQRGLGAFRGMLLGSVSQYCAHHASCPVMVGRQGVMGSGQQTIVVGFDGSDGGRRALDWAVREAALSSSPLRIIGAWDGADVFVTPAEAQAATQAELDAAVADLAPRAPGVEVTAVGVEGLAAATLIDAARDARMLVVGSRGLGGFRGLLLGSVGLHCLHHATCPVVVVPPGHHDR